MKQTLKLWKTLHSRVLLDYKGFKIIEDTVLLPNRKETTYIRREISNDSVIVIAINKNAKILIQKEYSHPPKKIMWQLPGGSIHDKENVIDAANRELSEESGYRSTNLKNIGFYYVNNRLSNQRQHVVVATNLERFKLQEDSDEFIENYWMDIDEILLKISANDFDNINLLAALNIWLNEHRKYMQ